MSFGSVVRNMLTRRDPSDDPPRRRGWLLIGFGRWSRAVVSPVLRQLCRSDLDGLFGQAPFEHAIGEADSSPAVGGEEPHCFVGNTQRNDLGSRQRS